MKNKKLPKGVMGGVYMIVNDLDVDENSRYDILVNLENNYSLVFRDDMSDVVPTIVIDYCEVIEFVEKLKGLRK